MRASARTSVEDGTTRERRHQTLREFLTFLAIGALNLVLDVSVFAVLLYALDLRGFLDGLLGPWPDVRAWAVVWRLDAMLARTAGFIVATTNGFFLNRWITFRASAIGGRLSGQFLRFWVVTLTGYLLSLLLLAVGIRILELGPIVSMVGQLWGPPSVARYPAVIPVVAAIGSSVVVPVWNFVANKLWTFRAQPPTASTSA